MGGGKSKPKENPPAKEYPADTVIVHGGFGRGFNAPSLSPFVIKIEIFLRVAKVKYEAEPISGMSKKGKIPYITYNGEQIADSELIIKYLNEKLDVQLNRHLTAEQNAVDYAFRVMNDEFFYWTLAYERFIMTPAEALATATNFPKLAIVNLQKASKDKIEAQGLGRHSQEEVYWFYDKCMQAFTDQLGSKPYLLGNQPSESDCAFFGGLAQIKHQMPGSYLEKQLNEKYISLNEYAERMKAEYWPDWDEVHTHGNTKQPTK